jgi:GT2 family glycosyltransferase
MNPQETPVSDALPGVSVVIVNYHTPAAIDTALEALLAGNRLDLDVIVVDQEPSAEEQQHHARWVQRYGCRVVPSPVNLGFAGGCNLGAEDAAHDWLLFLNSDAWMTQEHVARLLSAAIDGDALAAGPLSNRASDVQTMYTWNAVRRFRSPAAYLQYQHDVTDEPFAYHRLSGVCLLVQRGAFEDVGRFERSYGLGYFEDDELTVRLARRGTLLVVPAAFVYHQDGLSWRSTGRHERNLAMYVNRMRYLYRNCTDLLHQPAERPLISVIVTTLDRPVLLREALRSIARQSYRELEVVVVNDAGADVGDLVEQEMRDGDVQRWQYLSNERNLGKPASINRALESAHGDLIAYLDDDDEFLPDHLLAAANALSSDVPLDAVYFGSISRKVDELDQTVHREVVSNEWDVLRLLVVNILPNCALVHRRDLLERTGPYQELRAIEDWDFLRRASLVGRFLHVPLVTSTFRVRTDGATRNGLAKRSFESYMSVERQIRIGAPQLGSMKGEPPPEVWTALTLGALRPDHAQDAGRLENLRRASGVPTEQLTRLRPDMIDVHLQDEDPSVESAYAALLSAAGASQQIAALSALIRYYLRRGETGAAARLHGFLSYSLHGTEITGTNHPLETGRRVFEREGLRGLRELSVLSAKRRTAQLARRVRR